MCCRIARFILGPPVAIQATLLGEGGGSAINREYVGQPGSLYLQHFLRGTPVCQVSGPGLEPVMGIL